MCKDGEEPLLVNGAEVQGKATFVAETSSGIQEVEFKLNSLDLADRTAVIFERLYEDGELIAMHTDIHAASQTIRFPQAEEPQAEEPRIKIPLAAKTGDYLNISLWMSMLGISGALVVVAMKNAKKRH